MKLTSRDITFYQMKTWMHIMNPPIQLLNDYGLQMHGKEALDILAGAGCEVDYETTE